MAFKEGQRGIRNYARRRVGLDFPEWLGVRKEGDPSSIPPNKFREAINVRLLGGELSCRGGQSKMNATALAGCITGIFPPEFQFPTTGHTLFHAGASTGIAGGNGTIWAYTLGAEDLFIYDTTLTPDIDDMAISSTNVIFCTVRDGGSTKLYELTLSPYSALDGGAYDVASATLRGTITQGTVSSSSCCMLGTDVYVAHGTAASGDARIYKWDGSTFSSVDSPAIAGSLLIRPTHDSGLIVLRTGTVGSSSSGIRKMTSAGTWSSITGESAYMVFDVAVFNSKTYAIGLTSTDTHDVTLMEYNGTTYVNTTGSISELLEVDRKGSITVAQGKLWIALSVGVLTSFDGTNFESFQVTFPSGKATGQMQGLRLVDDTLVLMSEGSVADQYHLVASPGSNFTGTWTTAIDTTDDEADTDTTPVRLFTSASV